MAKPTSWELIPFLWHEYPGGKDSDPDLINLVSLLRAHFTGFPDSRLFVEEIVNECCTHFVRRYVDGDPEFLIEEYSEISDILMIMVSTVNCWRRSKGLRTPLIDQTCTTDK
jgi:hypothetical protein